MAFLFISEYVMYIVIENADTDNELEKVASDNTTITIVCSVNLNIS